MLISKATREADYDADPVIYEIDNPESTIFEITVTKLCSSCYFIKRK